MSSRISGRHFRKISEMFHISIPSQEVTGDKLRKVYNIYDIYNIYATYISNDNYYIFIYIYMQGLCAFAKRDYFFVYHNNV